MSCVLELMNYSAPYEGNFLSSIVSLADALRRNGSDAAFVFPRTAQDRAWVDRLREQGYAVYFLPRRTTEAARLLRRVCKAHGVTHVHSHFIDRSFYLPLRIACFLRPIRHIYHAHSMPHAPKPFGFLRRALLHTQKILCVSDAVRDALSEQGFTNCVTVPNGVDFARLTQAEPSDLPHPLVLTFGYDFFVKGIDTALEALDTLDTDRRFTLGICVAGHMAEAQQALLSRYGAIPSWVRLLGPRSDVGTYYRVADVFLSASRTEGMPYAVLEAAWCGLPLAISAIPQHRLLGLPRVLTFPAEDPAALFAALEQALKTGGDDQNRAYVESRYSIEAWTQAVLAQLFPNKEKPI